MIRFNFLLILLVPNILVKSNPILAQIPIQGLQITPGCQQSIPLLVQSPPVTNNVCPCAQKSLVQVPTTVQTNIPVNNNPLAKIILNKLFSSPSLKAIIDNNSRVFPQNCLQVQKQACCETPNIVNNYIIIPLEYFNLSTSALVQDIANLQKADTSPKQKSKNTERVQNKEKVNKETDNTNIGSTNNKEQNYENSSDKMIKVNNDNSTNDVVKTNHTQPRKIKNKIRSQANATLDTENQRSFDNEKFQSHSDISLIDNVGTNPKQSQLDERSLNNESDFELKEFSPQNLTSFNKSEQSSQVQLEKNTHLNQNSTSIFTRSRKKADRNKNPRIKTSNRNKSSRQRHDQPRHTGNKNKGRNHNHKHVDPRENIAIKDLQKIYPNVPEQLIRNIFGHVKQQVIQPHTYLNPSSHYSYPYIFEQFYKPFYDMLGDNSMQQKNNRNKQQQRRKNSSNNTNSHKSRKPLPSVETSLDNNENVTINKADTYNDTKTVETGTEITTESFKIDIESISQNDETEMPTFKIDELDDMKGLEKLKLSEDDLPSMDDMGVIYDYFPNFRLDNVLNEEQNRYENSEFEELNRERRKYEQSHHNFVRDKLTINNTNQVESVSTDVSNHDKNKTLVDSAVEEIIFRPPPFLENPDFETRPVYIKDYEEHSEASLVYFDTQDEYNDVYIEPGAKISSYSDVKNPQYTRIKPLSEIKRVKVSKKPMDVETVFAKSKIVKYGQPESIKVQEQEVNTFSETEPEYIEQKENEEFYPNNKDTTIVLAKSLGNPEDYW